MPVRLSSFVVRVAIARIAWCSGAFRNDRSRADPRAVLPAPSTLGHGIANPFRVPIAGDGVPLLVTLIVAVRFTPRGDDTLVNLIPTVQLPPGGSVCPVQASAVNTLLKK
jgi:hypothetical protein